MFDKTVSYIGFIFSVAATYILSYTNEYMILVFSMYFIGNISWIIVSVRAKNIPLFLQNFLFIPPSIFGIWNYMQ